MAVLENSYHNVDCVNEESVTSRRWFKVGVAVSAAFTIGFVATSISTSSAPEPIELVGDYTQHRLGISPQVLNALGDSPFKVPALLAIEAVNRQTRTGRDVSMQAVRAAAEEMPAQEQNKLSEAQKKVTEQVYQLAQGMPGITKPMGFFDPWGFCTKSSLGSLLYFREAELKHGRIGMIASLGLIAGEKFSPLLGAPNKPAVDVVFETPLGQFWYFVFLIVAVPEFVRKDKKAYSYSKVKDKGWWAIDENDYSKVEMPAGVIPGDYGFDPLGLAPKEPSKFLEMQNKELNNGRLAMLAAAGIMIQESNFKEKLF